MTKLPDDILEKIEEKAEDYRLLEEHHAFSEGAEFGYLLSVDKDKEIADGRKEIERLKLIAHEYAEHGRKEMERVDGLLNEIERLKKLIEVAYDAGYACYDDIIVTAKSKWQQFAIENNL